MKMIWQSCECVCVCDGFHRSRNITKSDSIINEVYVEKTTKNVIIDSCFLSALILYIKYKNILLQRNHWVPPLTSYRVDKIDVSKSKLTWDKSSSKRAESGLELAFWFLPRHPMNVVHFPQRLDPQLTIAFYPKNVWGGCWSLCESKVEWFYGNDDSILVFCHL